MAPPVASQTILPGELLATVCTGDFDFVMYPFDMACEVVQVPEAFFAVRAGMLVLPLFVMDADMVTEGVSFGRTSWVRLCYVPQTMLANANSSAVLAHEI